MKLTAKQIENVEQNTGLQPIPEDNPAMSQLKENFGDHTFYLDERGLYVLEAPTQSDGEAKAGTEEESHATAVQVASWADDQKTALQPHEPVATDAVVKLSPPEK